MALGACSSKVTPEDAVRATIRRAIEAANDRNASKTLSDASQTFKGPRGADVRECRRILLGFFLQQGWIKVFERALTVEVDGNTAHATLDVIMAQGNPVERIEDIVPKQATELIFSLDLALEAGKWTFVRADYARRHDL